MSLDRSATYPKTRQVAATAGTSVLSAMLPIMTAVFVAYLVIGIALPVIPLHVHQGLGLGTFVVGLVAGAQFTASLISRFWSGNYADSRGGKRTVVVGLVIAAAAGLFYLLSLRFFSAPVTSVTILLVGRAVLGGAESFIVSGALVWGMALVGPANTGRSWRGSARRCMSRLRSGHRSGRRSTLLMTLWRWRSQRRSYHSSRCCWSCHAMRTRRWSMSAAQDSRELSALFGRPASASRLAALGSARLRRSSCCCSRNAVGAWPG